MRHPNIFVVIYTFFIAFFAFVASFPEESDAADCRSGKRPLFFAMDPKLSTYMPPEFGSTLFEKLDLPLQEIGYCLTRFNNSVYNDSNVQEELVMIVSINFITSQKTVQEYRALPEGDTSSFDVIVEDTTAQIIVSLIAVNLWKTRERKRTLENPLLELTYRPDELVTFESVLIKKIIENLRTQYMCHLRIQSVPQGVHVRSKNGLEGVTPLEWITPLGKLPIIGELEGYEPFRRKITLNVPGTHTYELKMMRCKFYHSKWFIPTIALSGTSVITLGMAEYLNYLYDDLEEFDQERLFKKYNLAANTCAIIGWSMLACATTTFSLSFRF